MCALSGHINGPEMEAVCLNFSQNLVITMDMCHVMFQDVSLVLSNLIIFFVFICLSLLFVCVLSYRVYSRIGVDQINQSFILR